MTLYETLQYLSYKWKAKGRHGIHSPFVYAFVEQIALKSGDSESLIKNIVAYFSFQDAGAYIITPTGEWSMVSSFPTDIEHDVSKKHEMNFARLYIVDSMPILSSSTDHILQQMLPDDVMITRQLHTSPYSTSQWEQIKAHKNVKISLDLFDTGIVLFKNEFKEKQHFILKY